MMTRSQRSPLPSGVRKVSQRPCGFSFASHLTNCKARSIIPSGFGIATALLKASVGDVVTLRTPRGTEELEIVAIRYDERPRTDVDFVAGGTGAKQCARAA